jgi:hypothetical protein
MNIQTKYVKTNFVPCGSVSYNQSIAKKYFKYLKKQDNKKKPTVSSAGESLPLLSNEHEVVSASPEKSNKRSEIEKWLRSLDLNSKFKVFSIQNKWLSQMIQQMYYYHRLNPNNKFLLKPEEFPSEEYYLQCYYNDNQSSCPYIVNDSNYQYDIYFKYAALHEGSNIADERSFLEKIRFFDLKDSNEAISLSVSLLNNLEELFYFFDLFSKKKAFLTACTYLFTFT